MLQIRGPFSRNGKYHITHWTLKRKTVHLECFPNLDECIVNTGLCFTLMKKAWKCHFKSHLLVQAQSYRLVIKCTSIFAATMDFRILFREGQVG